MIASLRPLLALLLAFCLAAAPTPAMASTVFTTTVSVRTLVSTSTAIPGGSGFFTSFKPTEPVFPAISNGNVVFWGAGLNQLGLFRFTTTDPCTPSDPCRIADLNTLDPSGGFFSSFGSPAVSGFNVSFVANGSEGQQGVYITLANADQLQGAFPGKLPYAVPTKSTAGKSMVNDATVLQNYNADKLTPVCAP